MGYHYIIFIHDLSFEKKGEKNLHVSWHFYYTNIKHIYLFYLFRCLRCYLYLSNINTSMHIPKYTEVSEFNNLQFKKNKVMTTMLTLQQFFR